MPASTYRPSGEAVRQVTGPGHRIFCWSWSWDTEVEGTHGWLNRGWKLWPGRGWNLQELREGPELWGHRRRRARHGESLTDGQSP